MPDLAVIDHPSPNHGPRRGPVDILLLHYTGMESALASRDRLCDPEAQVSSHYLVDTDGTIWRLVDEARRAWHAGLSFWAGETDINSRSIGIEIQNQGPGLEEYPFPTAQIDAVIGLCRGILERHPILPHRVLGHSDVAIGRKVDPGPEFPWPRIAAAGIGLWPGQTEPSPPDMARATELLARFGYAVDDPVAALDAFRLHWVPEVGSGVPVDPVSMGRLEVLAASM